MPQIITYPQITQQQYPLFNTEAVSNCIIAKIISFMRHQGCNINCDCDELFRYYLFSLIDDAIHYQSLPSIFTDEQIIDFVGFTGCINSSYTYTPSTSNIITGHTEVQSGGQGSTAVIIDDYYWIGFSHTKQQADYDLTGVDFPNEFWLNVDNNNEYVGFANTANDLINLLNAMNYGSWSLKNNIMTGIGFHLFGKLFKTKVTTGNQPTIDINTNVLNNVLDIYGVNVVDASVSKQRSTDSTWVNYINALQPVYLEFISGPTTHYVWYKTPSDGYNISQAECSQRGLDINQVLGGVGASTYGYGFFEDFLSYVNQMSPKPQVIIPINLIRPFLNNPTYGGTIDATQNDYTKTYAEIDYIIQQCNNYGITIKNIQLGYELGLSSAADAIQSADALISAYTAVQNYIRNNYSNI